MIVTLASEQRLVASPAPAKFEEKPQPQATVPAPVPERKRRQPAAQPKPAATAPHPVQSSPQSADKVQEIDDTVGRIHDNWLEPSGSSHSFHCRIHIDYAADGVITAVRILQDCGGAVLNDSVRRAVWKTQQLTLSHSEQQVGSVEIDFTP